MPLRGEVRDRPATQAPPERRVDVDLIRFESVRLPSGLYRHTVAKYVFELGGKDAREDWKRK